MILVTLGTQDKTFERLLKAIDKQIKKGNIKDRVVVQSGFTKYESNNMEIFDLIPMKTFDKLMDEADLIITHGGVGSILGAIRKNKKVIAIPRLAKYKEHTNDHQKQIVDEFVSKQYILTCKDLNKIHLVIEESQCFKPQKYKSSNNKMIKIIENFIEDK